MVDFGNAFTGAATGAGLGSAFGPLGTAAGGILGGLSGLLGFGKSKPERIKQMKNYNPQQEEYLDELLEMARAGDKNAFDYINSILSNEPGAFEDFERPAMEQFEQEIIPSILERFAGAGASSSSALNQTLGQYGKSLSSDLAAQRANLKQNAIQMLSRYSEQGLRPRTTPYTKGRDVGAFEALAPKAGEGYSSLLQQMQNRRRYV